MKPVRIDSFDYKLPSELCSLVGAAELFDTSGCSGAKTFFADIDGGYYIKISNHGSLKNEARVTDIFSKSGLAPKVVSYISEEYDFLVTERLHGENAASEKYLDDPKRLCRVIAEAMRRLHNTNVSNYSLPYVNSEVDISKLIIDPKYSACVDLSDIDAQSFLRENLNLLKHDALIHGDFCLPNLILDDWKLAGFIDVGDGGLGDRHFDIFWAIWSLGFNLGTNEYRDYFLSCYGDYDPVRLKLCAIISSIS